MPQQGFSFPPFLVVVFIQCIIFFLKFKNIFMLTCGVHIIVFVVFIFVQFILERYYLFERCIYLFFISTKSVAFNKFTFLGINCLYQVEWSALPVVFCKIIKIKFKTPKRYLPEIYSGCIWSVITKPTFQVFLQRFFKL